MGATTIRDITLGGKKQKKQRQSKGGKTKKVRKQQNGGDVLQKVVNFMKQGGRKEKTAKRALSKTIGGNPNIMDKLEKLLPSE